MSFPKCFDEKVDLKKVKLEVIHQWVTERITQLLGFEDDIVVSLVNNLLEPKVDEKLDPRHLQISITGFLEKDTATFTQELWELLLSAQAHATGIPTQLLEKKKQELEQLANEKEKLRQVLEKKRQETSFALPVRRTSERENPPPGSSAPSGRSDKQPPAADDANRSRKQSPRRFSDRRDHRERSRSRSPRRKSPSPRRRSPVRRRRSPSPRRRHPSSLHRSSPSPRRRSPSPRRRRERRSPSPSRRSKSRSASNDRRTRRR